MMNLERRKLLGSYFTPSSATELMARWALRHPNDVILEPSLGDGQFLRAIDQRANVLGWAPIESYAAELNQATAEAAIASRAIAPERLHVGGFLEAQFPPVDVIIGNPPYVRLRALTAGEVDSAQAVMERTLGCPMDPAGSLWMPFVVKSVSHLKLGGRMGMVLPLDFTYVRYARPLWRFLAQNFGCLKVVRFQQRVFSSLSQNVLILLADDKGKSTDVVEFVAGRSVYDVDERSRGQFLRIDDITAGRRVFQSALISNESAAVYEELLQKTHMAKEQIKFNIGYISGNKSFFHPSSRTLEKYGLPTSSLHAAAVSAKQLASAGLRTSGMRITQRLWLPTAPLSEDEIKYVDHGKATGVHAAYKCRIREPWFVVPGVKKPDVFLTVFSDLPRLHVNDGGWVASNSILCGYLRDVTDSDSFAASWYSALTLLSTELEIHSLGGGVMIAVPREADTVRILNVNLVEGRDLHKLGSKLSENQTEAAYRDGDVYLKKIVGKQGTDLLWSAVEELGRWRRASPEDGA